MINIRARIKRIAELLENGEIESLTYAALECRLSIELICYERLMISYGYTSYADLRRWQPREVVQQVVEEANDNAAKTFTISISKTPVDAENPPETKEEYEKYDYQEVGTQVGLQLRDLGKLWNSLSNVALHVHVPKSNDATLSPYGDLTRIRDAVEKSLSLLRKIAEGNLLASGFGPEISFECLGCKQAIKRKVNLVRDGMTTNCSNPLCKESYTLNVNNGEILHSRWVLSLACEQCQRTLEIPSRVVDKLRRDEVLTAKCGSCGNETFIQLLPCKASKRT